LRVISGRPANRKETLEYEKALRERQKARFATFPNLKPTTTAISLRVPNSVLARLKVQAHRKGMPYQSFIKGVLADAVGPK